MGSIFSTFSAPNEPEKPKEDPLHLHRKSRGCYSEPPYSYAMNLALRTPVPDSCVPWSVKFLDYKPVIFTASEVAKQPVWADPKDPTTITNFNEGKRRTHMNNHYRIEDGVPVNPVGRTGMRGRGLLGKWGPNHAADPLVTRIKPGTKDVIEFIAVKRRDNGEWAIPGGMVEAGDTISLTLKKEFHEEAQNILKMNPEQARVLQENTKKLFDFPTTQLYKGYVDDPRNTDNAWMETCCTLFHDKGGDLTRGMRLEAGDDACGVQWMVADVDSPDFRLYASHKDFLRRATDYIETHFL